MRCAKISRPTLCNLPCVRYNIMDSSLFDKGQHPQFRWSRRWPSWDLVEVDTWSSSEIKTITVTQDVLGGSSMKIRCRKFIPMVGDSLARTWKKDGATVSYQRAPYAILSMRETGKEIKRFVANNISASIKYYILEKQDRLLSSTYAMAYAMVFRPRDFAEVWEIFFLFPYYFTLTNPYSRMKMANVCCKMYFSFGSPSAWNHSQNASLETRHWAWTHRPSTQPSAVTAPTPSPQS